MKHTNIDTKEQEINILNLQNVATVVYIGSLLLSIYITNNDKKCLLNNKENNTYKLSIFNRSLVVILTLIFLYISVTNRKIAALKNKKLDLFNLQVLASELTLTSTLIVLYVVIKSYGQNYSIISGVSNPNL